MYGMHSENTQKVLLTKTKLTLDKAVEISQGMEAAAQKSKELSKGSHRPNPVLTVQTSSKPCSRCGRGNHSKYECKFRNATCHKCGKVGHIAPSAPLRPGSLWNVEYLLTTSMPYISASVHPMNFYYAPTESFIFTLFCN